ncbi:hypothetical protein HK100_009614 [Physocladia obscura]|uniref:AMP-activated protein kinase glycogen-binding domain-containing protein n=1 Tax=Physocladia obscura TaxID=109957 RepID=A0AAD5SPI0_9FUNG|nr:hypothetical protein HK100_009614 [Physocladia obscura]
MTSSDNLTARLVWPGSDAKEVIVTGPFDNWSRSVVVPRVSNSTFAITLSLDPSVKPGDSFQFKFVVDGEWKVSNAHSIEHDDSGNENNVLTVTESGVEEKVISSQESAPKEIEIAQPVHESAFLLVTSDAPVVSFEFVPADPLPSAAEPFAIPENTVIASPEAKTAKKFDQIKTVAPGSPNLYKAASAEPIVSLASAVAHPRSESLPIDEESDLTTKIASEDAGPATPTATDGGTSIFSDTPSSSVAANTTTPVVTPVAVAAAVVPSSSPSRRSVNSFSPIIRKASASFFGKKEKVVVEATTFHVPVTVPEGGNGGSAVPVDVVGDSPAQDAVGNVKTIFQNLMPGGNKKKKNHRKK